MSTQTQSLIFYHQEGQSWTDRQSTHGHKYAGRPAVTGERQARVRQTERSLLPPPHDGNSDICTLHLDPVNTTGQSDLIKKIVATLAITQLLRIHLL